MDGFWGNIKQHPWLLDGFWMVFLSKKDSSLKPGALQRLLELMALDAATSSDFLEISHLARSSMKRLLGPQGPQGPAELR